MSLTVVRSVTSAAGGGLHSMARQVVPSHRLTLRGQHSGACNNVQEKAFFHVAAKQQARQVMVLFTGPWRIGPRLPCSTAYLRNASSVMNTPSGGSSCTGLQASWCVMQANRACTCSEQGVRERTGNAGWGCALFCPCLTLVLGNAKQRSAITLPWLLAVLDISAPVRGKSVLALY